MGSSGGAPTGGYLPIAEHGVIGDLHTVALVGTDGTIDWYCRRASTRRASSARSSTRSKGGYFRIAPVNDDVRVKQLYFPDTNVLITRFLTADGVGEVQDFMPIHRDRASAPAPARAAGRLRARRDAVPRRVRAALRLRRATSTSSHSPSTAPSSARRRSTLALHAAIALERARRPASPPSSCCRDGETATFVLESVGAERRAAAAHPSDEAPSSFEQTVAYWRDWLAQLTLPRPLARDGAPLGADAEAAHLPRRPAPSSPRRRRACRSSSAARATGTTATPGSATPRSRSTRSCGSASREEAEAFMGWLSDRFDERRRAASRAAPDHVRDRRARRARRR